MSFVGLNGRSYLLDNATDKNHRSSQYNIRKTKKIMHKKNQNHKNMKESSNEKKKKPLLF